MVEQVTCILFVIDYEYGEAAEINRLELDRCLTGGARMSTSRWFQSVDHGYR